MRHRPPTPPPRRAGQRVSDPAPLASLACALALVATLAPLASHAAEPPPAPSLSADDFARCKAGLRRDAGGRGLAEAFDRHVQPIEPDATVLPLLDAQPEFTTPIWDYLAALVDTRRIADGRIMLQAHAALLAGIAADSGVDAATVVAVWGVESDYGRSTGSRPLLQSLSTLSCFGRRQDFFRGELMALLGLFQAGDLRDPAITGSWAGAFGQTQFMPSTYGRLAVDGDGDGRRDLVGSVADALASTANFLARAGWRTGEPWGEEVRLPAGFDEARAGRRPARPLAHWRGLGIKRLDGSALQGPGDAGLLLPAGAAGPAFLVFRNYEAIRRYNAADSYALAIALLADRLRGGPGLQTPWPTDDPGLGRDERRLLQELLLARGHAIGEPDGLVGTLTRRAIVVEQQRLGLQPADGRAGQRILQALLADTPPTAAGAASAASAVSPAVPAR